MDIANPSLVAGIFRDQAKADRAILELQHAGWNADQIKATGYNLNNLQETHNSVEVQPESNRIVVTVRAEDRTREAVNILVNNGANNSDLPPGIMLDQGILIRPQLEAE